MKLDLHTHSSLSDGVFSPEEIVDMACAAELRVLAITDHDSIASWDRARAAVGSRPLSLIPGVETSAACDGREFHILGYFRDGVPSEMRQFLGRALVRREERMEVILKNLRGRGVPLDVSDVRQVARGESLSRAHVAQVMVARGHVASIDQAFEEHLGHQHGIVPLALTPVEEAIAMVEACNGVSVWAHPPAGDLETLLGRFVKWGLGGLEAFRRRTKGVKTARILELGDTHGLVVTAGSDWHGHRGEPLTSDDLSFPPWRLRPFLGEFGLEHLAA